MSAVPSDLTSHAASVVPHSWVDGDEIASLPPSVLPDQQHYAPDAESVINESASQKTKSAATSKEGPRGNSAPTKVPNPPETQLEDSAKASDTAGPAVTDAQLEEFLGEEEQVLLSSFMTPDELLASLKAIGVGRAVEIIFILNPQSNFTTTGKRHKVNAFLCNVKLHPISHKEVDYALHIYETNEQLKKEPIFAQMLEKYGYITIPQVCKQLKVFTISKVAMTAGMAQAQLQYATHRSVESILQLNVFRFRTYHVLKYLSVQEREDYFKKQWKEAMNKRGLRFVAHFTWDLLWNRVIDGITEATEGNKSTLCESTVKGGQELINTFLASTAYQATGGATMTPSKYPTSPEDFVAKMQSDVKAAKEAKRAAPKKTSDNKTQQSSASNATRKRPRQDDGNPNEQPPASSHQNGYRRPDNNAGAKNAMASRRRRPRRTGAERPNMVRQNQQQQWIRAPYGNASPRRFNYSHQQRQQRSQPPAAGGNARQGFQSPSSPPHN